MKLKKNSGLYPEKSQGKDKKLGLQVWKGELEILEFRKPSEKN